MDNEQNYGTGYNLSGLEGKVVTARGIDSYENGLRLGRELFREQRVLNFGSGGSHLEKELGKWGINSGIINLDLVHDPSVLHGLQFLIPDAISDSSKAIINKSETLKSAVHTLYQKAIGIEGRKIIQGDGRNLPFPDESFDTVVALLSTYQIPQADRKQVFSELLRVGKAFHCAPIGITDYKMLQDLAYEHDYEIVMVLGGMDKDEIVQPFQTVEDYKKYIAKHPLEERIIVPDNDQDYFRENKIFGKTISANLVGATMVMVRKSVLQE